MSSADSSRLSGSVLVSVGSIPWRSVLVDLVLVSAWIVGVSFAFRTTGWPLWLYYVVVFGGVLGYSLATDRPPSGRDR